MKPIDPGELDRLPGRRLKDTDRFPFQCRSDLNCFNRCCKNLNLFLNPYDVVRLKQHLGISSSDFLEQYVDVVLRPSHHFPDVLLRMSEDAQKNCVFSTEAGCAVYPSRPYTCRLFPVEQASMLHSETGREELIHWIRPPQFCLGGHENRTWTIRTWTADQQAETDTEMTATWSALHRRFQTDPWGPEGVYGPKGKMTFMAAYNIDRFRDFVFGSSFLKRYRVSSALRKHIRTDDRRLLNLGFAWIRLFLWGIPSPDLRPK